MIDELKAIAKQNPEGFTVDLKLNPVTTGYVIAIPETQNCFGDQGLEKVLKIASENGYCIGGWLNRENGRFYWDASLIAPDLEEAKETGRKFNQIAIFDLNEQREIWL